MSYLVSIVYPVANYKDDPIHTRLDKVLDRKCSSEATDMDEDKLLTRTLVYTFFTEDFVKKGMARANAAKRAFGWEGVEISVKEEKDKYDKYEHYYDGMGD